MLKISKLYKNEDGAGLLLCIFVLFVILGVGGLVVDMGILYTTKSEMRKAANAAALSGVQHIFVDKDLVTSEVTKEVNYILEAHDEEENLKLLKIKPDGKNKVTVTLQKDVPLYFMKVFGMIEDPILEVESSAIAAPISASVGVVPIGIRDDVKLHEGENYQLRLQPGSGISGNYNLLSFPNTNVRDSIEYGYNYQIQIGVPVTVDTDPGSKTGQVKQGIDYRLDNNDTVLMVIIYDGDDILNGKSELTVMGFAFFDIAGMTKQDNDGKSITGKFIRQITVAEAMEGAVDKGAYSIKLVE